MKVFDRLLAALCRGALQVLVAIIVVSAFLQVFSRFVMNNPLSWTEELCRYGMVWMALIGSGLAVRKHSHICVDVLKNVFSPKVVAFINTFNTIMVIVFSAVIIFYGLIVSISNFSQTTPGLKTSMGLMYLAVPVGGFIMLCFALISLFEPKGKNEGGECA